MLCWFCWLRLFTYINILGVRVAFASVPYPLWSYVVMHAWRNVVHLLSTPFMVLPWSWDDSTRLDSFSLILSSMSSSLILSSMSSCLPCHHVIISHASLYIFLLCILLSSPLSLPCLVMISACCRPERTTTKKVRGRTDNQWCRWLYITCHITSWSATTHMCVCEDISTSTT